MKKWLFNPFVYVAGGKALFIGTVIMLLTAVLCFYSNTHFDAILHMHPGAPHHPLSSYFIDQFVGWSCLVVVFFVAAKIFSPSSIRFIDVAGTMALARWPAAILAILGFGISIPHTMDPDKLVAGLTAATVVCSLLSLVFVVWMVALFYNAFTVSCNMKGGKAVGVFVVGLLAADALSRVITGLLY